MKWQRVKLIAVAFITATSFMCLLTSFSTNGGEQTLQTEKASNGEGLDLYPDPLRLQKELSAQMLECVSANLERDKMTKCLTQVVQPVRLMPNLAASFLSTPVKYPFNHDFILNKEQACSAMKDLEVLVVIPSAPHFSKRRNAVRNSDRGKWAKNPSNKAVLLFFLGLPMNDTDSKLQQEIEAEAEMYGDIVQSDFSDNYRNILLKALSMLKWTVTFCQNAKYVIRTDDDVNVTMSNAINVMRTKIKTYKNFVIGRRKINDRPARSNNKWHLSMKEYPNRIFPPYVRGALIGHPISTADLLYKAALRYPPIWLDDVYITGLCASRLGIPVLADKKFDYEHILKPGDIPPRVTLRKT